MFLRKSVTRRKGKTYCYWQIVESVRTGSGTKQRVVAHLGDLAKFDAAQWRSLAERLGEPDLARQLQHRVESGVARRGRPPNTLKLESPRAGATVLPIRLDGVAWEDARSFGDVYAGLEMWRRSGLGEFIEEKLAGYDHSIPMDRMVAANVVARLVRPRSELETARWAKTTALPELLGLKRRDISKDRLYQSLDLIWPLKAEIEALLESKGRVDFGQQYQVLLYDLSSTYFEGRAPGVPKANRGYSRDHRPDCKQIVFGVVVTVQGWPTGYETHEGNIHDDATLPGVLTKLERRFGRPKAVAAGEEPDRITVMDRGLLTDKNLTLLREQHYGYLLAEKRGRGAAWYWQRGQEKAWEVIRKDDAGQTEVEVQEIGTDGNDRLILVRSRGCRQKEKGIHDRVLRRLREDLEAMAGTLSRGRLRHPDKIQQRLGRLQERHAPLWNWVKVRVTHDEKSGRSALEWEIRQEIEEAVRRAEGVYLLRTNLPKRSAKDLWENYIRLTVVESVFRALKHDLRIRPIFHQKGERVEGHMFFSFLAYVLYWMLEREHRLRGGKRTGRMLLQLLSQIQLGTIRLKTKGGQSLRLKRVSAPSRELAEILRSLDLRLPRTGTSPTQLRLSRPD